jgi:predicted acylesterase/phospholipase RssA
MPSGDRAFGHVVGFNDVFKQEISVINARRGEQRAPAGLQENGTDSTGEPLLIPTADSNLIGLALSGGGVRSAAFCLGALQALDEAGVIAKADYLSTVSGGGYIGCSLSASLDATEGDFPFKTGRFEDETPALQHIRDYSNYLFPDGAIDAIHNIAIYARGLVANCILLAPFLLGFAVLTIFNYRTSDDLNKPKLLATTSARTTFFLSSTLSSRPISRSSFWPL